MNNELKNFETVIAVSQTKWESIHKDYKGTWSRKDVPYFVGKKTVMSGSVSEDKNGLLIEGYHFIIVPDNDVHEEYYTSQCGEVYEYIGVDDWHRPLLRRLRNNKNYVLVDGNIYTISGNFGEPCSSVYTKLQLKEKGLNYPFDKLLTASSYELKYTSTLEDYFAFIDKDNVLYGEDAKIHVVTFNYRTHSFVCVFDANSKHYELNPKYSDEVKKLAATHMSQVVNNKAFPEEATLNKILEEIQYIKPLQLGVR